MEHKRASDFLFGADLEKAHAEYIASQAVESVLEAPEAVASPQVNPEAPEATGEPQAAPTAKVPVSYHDLVVSCPHRLVVASGCKCSSGLARCALGKGSSGVVRLHDCLKCKRDEQRSNRPC